MSEYTPNEELLALRQEHLLPTIFAYYQKPIQLVRGEMQYAWDSEGKRYLDAFGGIVTISVGHCHPLIVERVKAQLERIQHTTCVYLNEPFARLAAKVAGLAPGKLNKCFFPNSGSEANEMALLLARSHTGRATVIALRHGYHGGTSGVMALVGQHTWKHEVPYAPGVIHAPQPNCYKCSFGLNYPECGVRCAHFIEEVIQTSTPGRLAAFIAEPIQGFGGFVVPPKEYFRIVAKIVRQAGGLFIADEVQTGVGRTGKHWFGIQHWGVEPDIVTMAKGFGNGATIGGLITTDEVAASLKGKLHFATYGGNPCQCTQALTTLEIIEKEKYLKGNVIMGAYLFEGLKGLEKNHSLVGQVRGKGLLLGLEMVKDDAKKTPAAKELAKVMEFTRDAGLLIGKGGLHGNVLRITPPFCITRKDCDFLVNTLDDAFKKAAGKKRKKADKKKSNK